MVLKRTSLSCNNALLALNWLSQQQQQQHHTQTHNNYVYIIKHNNYKKGHVLYNIGFPGQFRRFVIPFDEGVIQIREINVGHEIRSSNLYFGHSNSHFGQEI